MGSLPCLLKSDYASGHHLARLISGCLTLLLLSCHNYVFLQYFKWTKWFTKPWKRGLLPSSPREQVWYRMFRRDQLSCGQYKFPGKQSVLGRWRIWWDKKWEMFRRGIMNKSALLRTGDSPARTRALHEWQQSCCFVVLIISQHCTEIRRRIFRFNFRGKNSAFPLNISQ